MTIAALVSQKSSSGSYTRNIRVGAALSKDNLLMNVLAATMASYGLFANSPAVVIGAMVVAMLLGPILGVSLALVDIDTKFLLRSLTSLPAVLRLFLLLRLL